jgi:hypothetical protein
MIRGESVMQLRKRDTQAAIAATLLAVLFATAPLESASAKEAVLYSFKGGADGQFPWAALMADSHGNLYGTTYVGGAGSCTGISGNGCGTVFELQPSDHGPWTETVLYTFQGGSDGSYPQSALVPDRKGNLYGTTSQGGTGDCSNMGMTGCGTVFELSPQDDGTWGLTTIYNFQGVPGGSGNGDAAAPNSLVVEGRGKLAGLASNGGTCLKQGATAFCDGAGFELRQRNGVWSERVIFRADSSTGLPGGALLDAHGNLYGVALAGGPENVGEVFMLTPTSGKGGWAVSALYAFQNQNDGALPVPGLVFDAQGNLYGASAGTDSVTGNVFELTPGANNAWTESVVVSFDIGVYPQSGPIMDAQGNLFGTTANGGASGDGSVFEAIRNGSGWTYNGLHDFTGGGDGAQPLGGLTIGRSGDLYGTTTTGGSGRCSGGCGTAFRVTP